MDKSTCDKAGAFIIFNPLELKMSAFCNIIYSGKLNRYYVGATNDNVESRLEKHNAHVYGQHRFTTGANDWILFLKIEATDYSHAVRIERKIKSMKSKTYILNLQKYIELRQKLYETTST